MMMIHHLQTTIHSGQKNQPGYEGTVYFLAHTVSLNIINLSCTNRKTVAAVCLICHYVHTY